MRRAKIVCTLGPTSQSQEQIDALVQVGMDCARLNFSHGDHETHAAVAARVREAARKARRPVAILGDLSGPKMRVGRFEDGKVELAEGARFTLTTEPIDGNVARVSVTYPQLPDDVQPGDKVLLDDGLLRLRVVEVDGRDVVTEVEVGGTLSNNKGLNLPGANLSVPALTEKDERDLEFAVDHIGVDFLALSFVRRAADVKLAQDRAKGTPVIAKIEKPEAVDNLQEIADTADGAMVARGDLGVELGPEKVPLVQKRIIREVNRRGKIVITATQMLDSMIRNPRPTRAEAADVANAVLDGTDAVMLSGETASGRYPLEAVRMMDAIVREAEGGLMDDHHPSTLHELMPDMIDTLDGWGASNAAARAAALMTFTLPLRAIVAFSTGGETVQLLSEYRPRAPVIAITADWRVANRLALEWGVIPRVEPPPDDMEETLRIACALIVREGYCKPGDLFAIVSGWPPSARPNTLKIHRL